MRDRGRKSRGAPAVRGSMARHGNHTSSPSITRRTIDLSSLGTLPRARLLPIRYVYVCIARYIFQRRRPRAGIHSRSLKSVRCVVRIFFFFFLFQNNFDPEDRPLPCRDRHSLLLFENHVIVYHSEEAESISALHRTLVQRLRPPAGIHSCSLKSERCIVRILQFLFTLFI